MPPGLASHDIARIALSHFLRHVAGYAVIFRNRPGKAVAAGKVVQAFCLCPFVLKREIAVRCQTEIGDTANDWKAPPAVPAVISRVLP